MTLTPKDEIKLKEKRLKIFLAGTIDNGDSVDWQSQFAEKLEKTLGEEDVVIYNPRNAEWDTKMQPVLSNPKFKHQVLWEHEGLCSSDYIIMNLLPDSKSPISLMELGAFADSSKLLVICPDEFYRVGNVDFYCNFYDIPKFDGIDTILDYLKQIQKQLTKIKITR